ncbi:MAG: hypothetical protein ACJ72Z_10235 [Pyrinomonadaceae bacterium]
MKPADVPISAGPTIQKKRSSQEVWAEALVPAEAKYLDEFMLNINWEEVNRRFEALK